MPTRLVIVFVLVDSFLFSHRLVLVRIKRFVDGAYDDFFFRQQNEHWPWSAVWCSVEHVHFSKNINFSTRVFDELWALIAFTQTTHSVSSTFLCLGKIFIGNKRDIAEGRIPELNTYMKVTHTLALDYMQLDWICCLLFDCLLHQGSPQISVLNSSVGG